jgi:hypothetical protein
METQFYITITLKTHKGLESFAKFYIGNNVSLRPTTSCWSKSFAVDYFPE